MKKKDRFPHAKSYSDRHGKRRWRYRHKGFSAELGTEWGGDEFKRRYADAENRVKGKGGAGQGRTIPGTFNDLVVRFYQIHFPLIEESTRADYRAVIEPLRRQHGTKRVSALARRHVVKMKSDMAETPQQANKTLKRLSQMMDLAMELEWRTDNPVKGIKRFPPNPEGYHTWDESEIAQFYAVHEMGTVAHRAMTLMLYTGAARCDAVKLSRAHIRDGRLTYRRRKTKKNPSGIEVSIPVHPYLAETLSHVREDAFTFLETAYGSARSADGLGNKMREACDKAELPLCTSHGLRKAICRRIAEIENDVFKVMAVSGHTDLKEAQKYIEQFGRKEKADSAISSLPGGVDREQKLANHPLRFTNNSSKPLRGK